MNALLLLCATALLVTVADAQGIAASVVVRPPAYVSAAAGQTVRVTCVGYGNPSVSFTWAKSDGQNFNQLDTSGSSISITTTPMTVGSTTYYVSVLQMCNVSTSDATQYACNASNGASSPTPIATSSATFMLSVSPATTAPPAIVVRPPATNDVDVNSIVELVCVAYGNPVPTISWGRSDISNIHNDSLINALVYSDIVSYGDVMFRKSVLQFCTISSRDSNAYICSATNGINGAGIASSTATFNVAVILQPTTTSPRSTSTSTPSSTTSTPQEFVTVSETGYQAAVAILVILAVVLIVVLVGACLLVFVKKGIAFSSWKDDQPEPAINEAADDDFTKMKFSDLEASNISGEYDGQYEVAN